MRLLLVVSLIAVLGAFASPQGKRKGDIRVVEVKARRMESKISLDGKIQITASKPIRGLILMFDFVSPQGDPLLTEKTQVEESDVQPDQELPFRVDTAPPPGAVRYSLRAYDLHERPLRVENAGPFTID
jgi:hypothetical protein